MASPDKVIIYTTTHCPDCQRAKRFLEYVGVPYREINVDEDAEARQVVREHNDRKVRVPTFQINGKFLGNPPLLQLARILEQQV